MKIKVKEYDVDEKIIELSQFINDKLIQSYWDYGELETIKENANNISHALSKTLDILAEKGIISSQNIKDILNLYMENGELEEEFPETKQYLEFIKD